MMETKILLIILAIHSIGAIISIVYCIKKGIFKHAAKTGDGIRFANASDILFYCLVLWEFFLFGKTFDIIDKSINNAFLETK